MSVFRQVRVAAQMVAAIGLFFLAGQGAPAMSQAQGRSEEALAEHVPNQVLVQYRAGASENGKTRARGRVNAEIEETVIGESSRRDGKGDLELLRVAPGLSVAAAVRGLEADPEVEFAEPNWVYQHAATSNDTYYTSGQLWGMYGDGSSPANQYGSQAAEAWANGKTGSTAVYVGIIDEGIQFDHPDLAGNIWVNPFDPVNGVDDDGNGYVDDVRGWDFNGNDNGTYDGGKGGNSDDHGTHVAGTIGARGGNNAGVAGVNWNVTMISGKFLGRSGGTTANAVKAVRYFTDLKVRHGLNIVATNNSWGGGGFSQALLDAIVDGAKEDILFIAAAGNGGRDGVGDNNDSTASYPSNYNTTAGAGWDAVIAVAAITSTGAKAGFSNYGATTVDIGAPGSGVISTTAVNNYSSYSGTSMATPHVTGAAALHASIYGSEGSVLKNAILNSAIPTASMAGRCVTNGRLNVGGF